MNIPDWVRELSVLLSPVFALAGVGLASFLSSKREREAHERQLERDRETHLHARRMWLLEQKRAIYPKIINMAHSLESPKRAPDTLYDEYQDLLMFVSVEVHAAMWDLREVYRGFYEAATPNLSDETQKRLGDSMAKLMKAMRDDLHTLERETVVARQTTQA